MTDPVDLLRSDIAAIRRDLGRLVSGRLGAFAASTRESLGRAGETMRETADQVRERAGEMHEKLRESAAARPLTTIALSVAAGAVLVKVLGWMRHR